MSEWTDTVCDKCNISPVCFRGYGRCLCWGCYASAMKTGLFYEMVSNGFDADIRTNENKIVDTKVEPMLWDSIKEPDIILT
jgi:hypothetical protein